MAMNFSLINQQYICGLPRENKYNTHFLYLEKHRDLLKNTGIAITKKVLIKLITVIPILAQTQLIICKYIIVMYKIFLCLIY